MIGPWREMLSTTVKCPCGQKGRWQRMTKVYEDSEPDWEHSCDRCMFAGSGGVEGNAAARRDEPAQSRPAGHRTVPGSKRVDEGNPRQESPGRRQGEPVSSPARSRKDRKPLPAPIEQKVCSRCGLHFRGYREHCVKCRRWGEPGRPPIPENEKPLNPGQSKA